MTDSGNKNNSPGITGKIVMTFFLLIFLLAGLFGTVFTVRDAFNTIRSYTWIKTEFISLSSDVKEDDEGYSLIINYKYDFQGQSYRREYKETSITDYFSVKKIADKYKTGSNGICYVNPSYPSASILKHKSLCFLPFISVPLLFMVIACLVIYGFWAKEKKKTGSEPLQALSKKGSTPYGKAAGAFFFGIFFIAGVAATYYMTYKPLVKLIDTQSWIETPCKVISSRIVSHEGDESTTYSADILYVYKVNGIEYRANRYRFFTSSGSYRGADRLKNKYPPGRETVCYVNPLTPGEATIMRDFTKGMVIYLLPVIFILVGAGGVYGCLKKELVSPGPSAECKYSGHILEEIKLQRDVELKPQSSPFSIFAGLLIFSLLWNGIISIPVINIIEGFKKVSIIICFAIAIMPFVLIGIFLAVSTVYYFLKLFNPSARPVLSCHPLSIGGTADLSWTTGMNAGAVKKYRIYIEGREEVKHDDPDDHHTFLIMNLIETENLYEIEKGKVTFTIPEDTIHSFKSEHNKIVWTIHVVGEIKYWPDINEEFEVTVLPKNMTER